MNEATQISLIAGIMKTKNKNGSKRRSKSKMTCPTLSPEMMSKFKTDFVKIFADNKGEWLRWTDVSQTVIMNDREMSRVSKEHNRNNCLGPSVWTMVMKELVGGGVLETDTVGVKRFLRVA